MREWKVRGITFSALGLTDSMFSLILDHVNQENHKRRLAEPQNDVQKTSERGAGGRDMPGEQKDGPELDL